MQDHLRHLGSTEQVPIDEPVIGVSPPGTPLLELRSVCKRYGSFAALDNVNFFIGKVRGCRSLGRQRRRQIDARSHDVRDQPPNLRRNLCGR